MVHNSTKDEDKTTDLVTSEKQTFSTGFFHISLNDTINVRGLKIWETKKGIIIKTALTYTLGYNIAKGIRKKLQINDWT